MVFFVKTSRTLSSSASDECESGSHSMEDNSDGFSDESSTHMSRVDSDIAHTRTIYTRSRTKMALMRHHLSNGQRVLHKTRCRISGSFLMLGLICSVCVIFEFSRQESLEELGMLNSTKYVDQAIFGALMYFFQIICCCLAPMADDPRLTRWALLQLSLVGLLAVIFLVGPTLATYLDTVEKQNTSEGLCLMYGIDAPNMVCDMKLVQLVMRTCSLALLVISNFIVVFWDDTAHMQRAMWGIATVFIMVETGAIVIYSVTVAILMHVLDPMSLRLVGMLPALAVSRMKTLRSRVQMMISGMARYRNNRAAAAGIAGLVGNCSIHEVMGQAKKRFRSVDFSLLDENELATNRPSPAVFALSQAVKLGCCDAFVSHSWHDDAPAKWVAMNWWRSKFERDRRRAPHIWLDKCCIDQNDIEADLRCLPIFLSGCAELVVFCGPTYLSRLWCVMELFTFVHIGGNVSEINVIPVLRRGHELEDRSAMRQSFLDFDVVNCECFNSADKEKMLDIIQMAFGDLLNFNEAVRSVLHAIDWMRTCPREWIAGEQAFEVPPDSPIPSIPSPVGVQHLPEDSPIPSMPSPKEYQWLN